MACPTLTSIEQTLFLGCTVSRFSCNLGWGEQVTTVDIELVKDICESPETTNKVYYDIVNYPDSPKRIWTGVDPGLKSFGVSNDEYPKLGAPCYFRFGDFEFCGILQSWQKQNVKSDTDVYNVKLVSPVEILAGTQCIIGDYTGAVNGFNILNVYGFLEYFSGKACPSWTDSRYPQDGIIFGSQAGGLGGADLNDSGIPWSKIRQAVSCLSSSFVRSSDLGMEMFSEYGRICGKGGNENFKFGLLAPDFTNIELGITFGISNNVAFYLLDLSELPSTLDDIRIIGPNLSVLELITQVTNQIGYDYYIELLPVNVGGVVYKVIKVRTVSRNVQPEMGIIEDYVNNIDEVIDSSFGRELRLESTTNFLIGGQKQNIWQVENGLPDPASDPDESFFDSVYGENNYVRDRIVPFYGTDTEGNIYVEYSDSDDLYINVDLRAIKTQLNLIGSVLPNSTRLDRTEILMAGYGFDQWIFYVSLSNNGLGAALADADLNLPVVFNKSPLFEFSMDKAIGRDFMRLAKHNPYVNDITRKDLENLYQFVKGIYDNYSTLFMVRLPNVCAVKRDVDVILSDEIADGGWTEASNILGLSNPGGYVDMFRNEDGTIRHLASYQGINGTGGFNSIVGDTSSPILVYENKIFTAVQALNQIVFLDNTNYRSARVIIESPQLHENEDLDLMFAGWTATTERLNSLLVEAQASGKVVAILRDDLEAELLKFGHGPRIIEPSRVAIATKSNVENYGPWKPSNIIEAGPPGQIQVNRDDTLVPWTYGSLNNLDSVAQAQANVGVTVTDEVENGFVKIAGIPDTPIGAELASLRGLADQYYNTNQHLIENRSVTVQNHTFNTPDGSAKSFTPYTIDLTTWSGQYGPQINGITYTVGIGEVTTTYNFRTFSPRFGFLSKLNADRLSKRLADNEIRRKLIRIERTIQQLRKGSLNAFKKLSRELNDFGNWHDKQGTPHSLLVGEIKPWSSTSDSESIDSDFRRSIVVTKSIPEILNNMGPTGTGIDELAPFDSLAIMSMDGLIRPVSMDGAGDLPRYVTPSGDGSDTSLSRGAHPFFNETNSYKAVINTDYLNPFSNPSNKARGIINERHDGDAGHDIDIIARGVLNDYSGDTDSLIMSTDQEGYESNYRADYNDDYRPLALRGPLLMHGWGYDTDGKPVPNAADTEENAQEGRFLKDGLEDKFLPDFLRKSHTWPVAPVDLRYDRSRGVWTSPQPRRQLCVQIKEDISALGSGIAEILDSQTYYDPDGNVITDKIINVRDYINISYNSGIRAIVDYDEYDHIYRIIESPASGTSNETVFPFKFTQCMPAGGPGSGIRIAIDENGNDSIVGDPFRVQCIHNNLWGPCPSGYRGWASTGGLHVTGTGGIDPDTNYSIINCDTLPEFIEFQAETGFPTDTVDAYVINSWNGGPLQNEYVKVTLPGYITQSAFIPGSEDIRGTAVINRRRTEDESFNSLEACEFENYYYDVIELFGISASGSVNVANTANPPLAGDRFGLLEFGAGFSIEKIDTNHLLISSSGSSNTDMVYFTVSQFDPSYNIITANTGVNLPSLTPEIDFPIKIYDKWGATWITGEEGFAIFETGITSNMEHGEVNWSTLREHRGRNFKVNDRKETTDNPVTITWLDNTLADIAGAVEDIYDPHAKFAARANAKGMARLVSDPKNNLLRWEIEELESPAMVVCGLMDADFDGGTPVDVTVASFMGPEWAAGNPGATVKAESCTYNDVKEGTSVTLYRKNPNTDPPLYTIISVEQTSCANPVTGVECGLFLNDNQLQLNLTSLKCTGDETTEVCTVSIPYCEDALVDITCDLDFYDGVLYQTLYLTDCTGGSRNEPCQTSISLPSYCENPLTGVTCSQTYDDQTGYLTTTLYSLDCSGGMSSSQCDVYIPTGAGVTSGILIPVITGCADPFVTFDSEGNPSFNFAYANVRVLSIEEGGTKTCEADGTDICGTFE